VTRHLVKTRPLDHLAAQHPDAPRWFRQAIAHLPEERLVTVEGARIEALSWGAVGKPGLLFIHGNLAHAHWWSFIAPFFAQTYRITALSLSGMGQSDHRAAYSMEQFGREAIAVAEATGLFESSEAPVILGHSAGAGPTALLGDIHGDRLQGIVILDSGIRPPAMMPPQPAPRERSRIYPTLEEAIGSYRFAPPQISEHLYIVDWLARHALKPVDGGWTWRFDPRMFSQVRAAEAWDNLIASRCPIAFINGANSTLTPPERVAFIRSQLPSGTPFVTIPEAAHHLMVDQPIAVVTAIRAVLAQWRPDLS
jgi:pimeloyl-ACP methyl ester carboxylesterase